MLWKLVWEWDCDQLLSWLRLFSMETRPSLPCSISCIRGAQEEPAFLRANTSALFRRVRECWHSDLMTLVNWKVRWPGDCGLLDFLAILNWLCRVGGIVPKWIIYTQDSSLTYATSMHGLFTITVTFITTEEQISEKVIYMHHKIVMMCIKPILLLGVYYSCIDNRCTQSSSCSLLPWRCGSTAIAGGNFHSERTMAKRKRVAPVAAYDYSYI